MSTLSVDILVGDDMRILYFNYLVSLSAKVNRRP